MGTTRSTIELQVLGLDDLRALNRAMTTWEKHLQTAQQAGGQYNTSLLAVQQSLVSVTTATTNATNATKTHNQAVQQSGQAAQGAGRATESFLGSLLKYRALSEVTRLLEETTKASKDYELQTARISRVRDGVSSPVISAELRQEVARYGVEIKTAGEGQYQLGTAIKDSNALLAAQDTLLKLVVGTQADARDTARAMVQVVNEFPDAFKSATTESEKYRRAGELLAVTFKDSNAEMGEISNSLKYLGPAFQSLGVNAEQAFGFITAATQAGVRGSKAGTDAASFFLSVIKKYNQELQGVEYKGKVYHFEIAYNKQGGIDAIETLKNIKRMSESLPANEQRAFTVAVSGTTKGFSFLGREGPAQLKAVEDAIKRARDATHGLTHEADDLAKKMQEPVWAQMGRAMAGGFALASEALDDILQKLNLLGGKQGAIKTIADGFEGLLSEKAKRDQIDAQIARRSLLEDAQQKQTVVSTAQSYIAKNPDLGKDFRVEGKLKRFYNVDDLAGLGPHAVSGYEQFHTGDDGRGQLTSAQMNLLRTYLGEHSKTGYFSAETLQEMLAQAKGNAGIFAAQDKAKSPASGSVSFRVAGDAKRVNQNLLEDVQRAAEELGMKIEVGTAITGHSLRTKDGNISRHSSGNAFDITQINGHPVNVKDSQGAALADKLVAYLKTEEGFGFGEGSHSKAFLWRTQIGGDHTNHLHVSDTNQPYDGPAVTDSPKALEAKQRKAEAEARKREAEARKREAAAEKAEQERDEKRKDAAEKAGIYYDAAAKALNPFDPKLMAQAKNADRLSSLAGDDNEKLKLALGLDGKVAELKSKQRDDYTSFFGIPVSRESVKAAQEKMTAWAEAEAQKQKQAQEERYAGYDAKGAYFRSGVSQSGEARLRALSLQSRPNDLFGDPQQDDLSRLLGTKSLLTETIAKLGGGVGPLAPETLEITAQFRERLADVNKELQDFRDKVASDAFVKTLDTGLKGFSDKQKGIDQKYQFGFHRSDDQALAQQILKARDTLANADAAIVFLNGQPQVGPVKDALKDALTRRNDAKDAVNDIPREYATQKYQAIYDQQKSTINSAIMDFFHGGDIANVFKSAGNSVVNAALENALKGWNDPLITATTNQIASLEGVRVALEDNTAALNGETGDPSGGAGAGAGASSGKGKSKGGMGGAGKYLSAGLGAYSLFEQGQQTGVNAGGILGGAISGSGIGATFGPGGALIGAIAGGALDLLGGLFGGHKKDPLEESKNHDPSQYNAPGDFDYYAYRYRMDGTLPTAAQLGVTLNQQPAPIVNVFVDQVKAAVKTEVAAQTSSASAATSNTYYDAGKPL